MTPKPILGAVLLMFAAGCASSPATQSGFLVDYSALKADDGNDTILIQPPARPLRAADFSSVFVAEPVIDIPELETGEAEQLKTVFLEELRREFTGGLVLADGPGPGTLHIRTAITEARKANVPLNIATTLLLLPLSHGSVSAEAEIVDEHGERLAAMSWTRTGNPVRDPGAAYAPLGQARAGLRAFARRFADFLESESDAAPPVLAKD